MTDAEYEMQEVVRAFDKHGLGQLLVTADGSQSPHIAVLRVLRLIMERDLDLELKRQPPRVTNAALATDLVARLNEFRKQIETSWPDNCCAKGIMRESNGRETLCCVDDCPWSEMELTIANALVDAEILAKRLGNL